MLELTDEMLAAFADQQREPIPVRERPERIRAGLAAVLAIVERDQRAAAQREWDALQQCPSDSPPIPVADGETVLHCEREAGHDGAHGAMRYLTSWRDLKPTGGAS